MYLWHRLMMKIHAARARRLERKGEAARADHAWVDAEHHWMDIIFNHPERAARLLKRSNREEL